jgi:gas vesicle protein
MGCTRRINVRLRTLRDSVSSFVDENIERKDVDACWKRKVELVGIDEEMSNFRQQLSDEIQGRLEEFKREMAFETELIEASGVDGPGQYDPWDIKRTLQWTSAGSGLIASVAGVASLIGGPNFWNPVGWIAGVLAVVAILSSWLFPEREEKLQRQRANAAKQLRDQIEAMEQQIATQTGLWFDEHITNGIVRIIRHETRQLYEGMFDLAKALRESARMVENELEDLNRRLLVKCGSLIGAQNIGQEAIGAVARDPGVRTKFVWAKSEASPSFCQDVGKALGEGLDGVQPASPEEMIAAALAPARILPEMVHIDGDRADVHTPHPEVERARGTRGHNVALASRLTGFRIQIVPEGSS